MPESVSPPDTRSQPAAGAPAGKPRLVLRADGNAHIGLGHIMRLVGLGEMLQEEYTCVFAIREPTPAVQQLLLEAGMVVQEVPTLPYPEEPQWLKENLLQPTDILLLDGYQFKQDYQQKLHPFVGRLVYVDDLLAFPQEADLVLNPAGGVAAADYVLARPATRLLLGPRYAPLRRPFRQASLPPHPAPTETALVCLGGADPTHQTRQVAEALLALPSVQQVHVVVGSAYAGWEPLRTWAQIQPRLTLHRNLAAPELCLLMQQCGTAVVSPSTVSYEYCAAGGGLLFLLPVAENQYNIDQFLRREGLGLPYHSLTNVLTSPEADRVADRLRQQQRHWFDGHSAARIRQEFKALQLPPAPFHLRPATAADSGLLLSWTNDPVVRQFSFNPNPVLPAEHEKWLTERLSNPQHLLLVAEEMGSGQPVGLIRFSLESDEATLSYLLAAAFRGQGLAPLLLVHGTRQLLAARPTVRQVLGHVQERNVASIRAFQRAGFQLMTPPATNPPDSVTFVWVN